MKKEIQPDICLSCSEFQPDTLVCKLFPATMESSLFIQLAPFACNPLLFLQTYIERYVALKYYPLFRSRENDLFQDVMVKLLDCDHPVRRFSSYNELKNFLVVVARNHIIDQFRKDQGYRQCGYCQFYDQAVCSLVEKEDGLKNPHLDIKLDFKQAPQLLQPPCNQFLSNKNSRDMNISGNLAAMSDSAGINPEQTIEERERSKLVHNVLSTLAQHSIRKT